ncbi:MAG: FtsX-like permease family protein [Mycetocola sp.]
MSAGTLARSELRQRPTQHVPSLIVTALGAAFGAALLSFSDMISRYAETTMYGGSDGLAATLTVLSILFLGIAVFVAGIVTTNTFSTIIAGRVHQIALTRVIGASASSLRRSVAIEGLIVGAIGSVGGVLIGYGASYLIAVIVRGNGVELPYPELITATLLVPLIASFVTTWLASWLGGARVLGVSPMQALGNAEELGYDAVSRRPVRRVLSILAVIFGGAGMAGGVVMGLAGPEGVLVAFAGGVLSFIGLIGLSTWFMPPALRLIGLLFGRGAAARLGSANAMRHPERSARSTIGIVIGITLITTFIVAASTVQTALYSYTEGIDEAYRQESEQLITNVMMIFAGLIGFAVVIALVGLVNTLTLSVLQRRREIGLLRAVGFTRSQVRTMILAESAQSSAAAAVVGVVLGIVYGWAGAQSLLGTQLGAIHGPTVPAAFIIIVIVATAAVALLASLLPARRATAVTPVAALAVD